MNEASMENFNTSYTFEVIENKKRASDVLRTDVIAPCARCDAMSCCTHLSGNRPGVPSAGDVPGAWCGG